MSPREAGPKLRRATGQRKREAERVAAELDRLCGSLQPGDKIPTHTVLMTQLGASQRTVLRALDDLMRAGRIVRRQKSGTFVAPVDQSMLPDGVVTRASTTVVAIASPQHNFFRHSVEVLCDLAKTAGVAVVFQPAVADDRLDLPLANFEREQTGCIVIGSNLIPLADSIASAGYRCVAIGEPLDGIDRDVARVHTDNRLGGYLCSDHLIALGHRRIGFAMTTDTPRWEGHLEAVAEAEAKGIELSTEFVTAQMVSEWGASPGLAAEFFRRPDAPTAVCLWNDDAVMGWTHILKRDGLRVPDDVSLTGYDNLPIGATYTPSITTVHTNMALQLRTALKLITSESPPPPHKEIVYAPSLVARGSTKTLLE
jgi:DNA-binding LacI/PurR family transcriptional regulator